MIVSWSFQHDILRRITELKFLTVDDEKDVEMLFRQKFRKELRSNFLELEFAPSGRQALEIQRMLVS